MIAYCFDRMFDSRFPVAGVNEIVSRRALDGRVTWALELQKKISVLPIEMRRVERDEQ